MAEKQTQRTQEIIRQIKKPEIRTILGIAEKHERRPSEVVTDGGVRLLAEYIVELEKERENNGRADEG